MFVNVIHLYVDVCRTLSLSTVATFVASLSFSFSRDFFFTLSKFPPFANSATVIPNVLSTHVIYFFFSTRQE